MLVAESKAMKELLKRAERVAGTDEPVLLLGETGVGKDVIARWIHEKSRRAGKPFLPLNCTALPEGLIESELFGYRRGAFTDARQDKPGLLEAVGGGTVFLDEVGDLPLAVQVKLLRVLETREVLPLGARGPVKVDFRLITATHRDLGAARAAGVFRDDLFYRIGVFVLRVPPLRERMEEVPVLVEVFAREVKPGLRIRPEVIERLMCYDWPGNVRELRNVVRHAALLAEDDEVRLEHLPEWLLETCQAPHVLQGGTLRERLQCFEQTLLERFLEASKGNLPQTLQQLGIARSSFYRKLRRARTQSSNRGRRKRFSSPYQEGLLD